MKRRNDQSLGEAIARLIDAGGMREKLDELDIAAAWDEVAGAMIARHTLGLRLHKGRLYVRVDSAPLRQELSYMRERIAELVNQRAGRAVVSEVVLG